jgi:hypothetical protein
MPSMVSPGNVRIELGRADGKVEAYHPRPFGCEVGSHFHQRHVSRGPLVNTGVLIYVRHDD